MAHQNVQSSKATAQNAATPSRQPGDQPQEEVDRGQEPRSYAAHDLAQSTLAAPAAGEMADYMDEGDALDEPGVQQGGTHANRPARTEAERGQGPKTLAANRKMSGSGSPEQG